MLSLPYCRRKRRRENKDSYVYVRQLLLICGFGLSTLVLQAAPVPSNAPSNYPTWWFSRGAIAQNDTNSSPNWPTDYPTTDDYAVINQGQLKNFATAAYNELQAKAPAYIWSTSNGTSLTSMVNGWNPANGDAYSGVNLGQLKTVATPFYNVLIQLGYTNNYPWTGVNADDYAAANIGQAKNLLSFDVGLDSLSDGVPDWWELKYLGSIGTPAGSVAPAGNGLTLLQDYQQGNDPTNYYSQGGTLITPTVTVTNGNNGVGPTSTFLSQALTVNVSNAGSPLVNAPVTFSLTGTSGGQFSTSLGGTASSVLTVNTDATGAAQVFYSGSSVAGSNNTIQGLAGTTSITFTESVSPSDGSVATPSGITATQGSSDGQIILNWTNNASNATYILVQQSIDGSNWNTVQTLTDPTATTATVTEANYNQTYYFDVMAGKP